MEDPRQIPYLFAWRCSENEGFQLEALVHPHDFGDGNVWPQVTRLGPDPKLELRRAVRIKPVLRETPNGGTDFLLTCLGFCNRPHRALYGWERLGNRLADAHWLCRSCSGLRYSSEGTYVSQMVRDLGLPARIEHTPWEPELFASTRSIFWRPERYLPLERAP